MIVLIALLTVWLLLESMFRPRLERCESGWYIFYGRFERKYIKL